MPPQTKTIEDIYKQFELDRLYAGKSSGDGESIIGAMQSQQRLASMPQGGAMQSLTPIGPIDFLAETAMTGASQMEGMNPLAMLLAGALAPGAYKKLKTTNTPALLKKFGVKVDNPLYHNTDIASISNILKTGRIKSNPSGKTGPFVSLTRDPSYFEIPGAAGRGDLDIQIIFDKKNISSIRGGKIKPYVHSKLAGSKSIGFKEGSPIFGKPSPWFEAEERIFRKKGIPSSNIKAIKLRSGEFQQYQGPALSSFLKKAADKKIPVIIEPAAEEGVMGLLDIMNPKQQSKVLKNTKFGGETVTLYRGQTKWRKGQMVKEGKFKGGSFEGIHVTPKKEVGVNYATSSWGYPLGRGHKSRLLEFEVPLAWVKKHGRTTHYYGQKGRNLYENLSKPFVKKSDIPEMKEILFDKGLPTAFLKKVHK
jgi:hypothetical protein